MAHAELLCTDLASVELALELGADRIELCAALEVGAESAEDFRLPQQARTGRDI